MKEKIKNILYEMINITSPDLNEVYFKKAYENLGFTELNSLIESILTWHKVIMHLPPTEEFQLDKFILDNTDQKRYPHLFNHCTELSEIYTLHTNKITFNENLSEEEKQEILKYIDDNHSLIVRKRRRK